MKTQNPRKLAFESLKKCRKDGKYSNLELQASLNRSTLDPRDKALYTALLYGVMEKEITLDYIISGISKTPLEKLDFDVTVLLRLGIYQIFFMDRVPDFSACDETVKLSPHSAKTFVNAVLRKACSRKEEILTSLEGASLSVKYSTPEWIIDVFERGYGKEKTVEILEGFLKKPPITLRTNTLKITPENLEKELRDRGIDARICSDIPDMIEVRGVSVEELYGYDEGYFFVQGKNSRRAVLALSLAPGETLIDTCACPGGKSFSSAIDMQNEGRVYSFDLHSNKLSLIEKGKERLGINVITTKKVNATNPEEELFSKADAVICDVPCSGLGIIAKKPDIKKKNEGDISRLPDVQFSILSSSSKYIGEKGRILYSTCTLNPDENEKVTEKFLSLHPSYKRAEGFPYTAFPSDENDDGFFFDLLIKV